MSVRLNPYLNFRDNARDAMEFYRDVFGGDLAVSTFGDYQASQDPAEQDKVMHAQLETPGGLLLMGADTPASMGEPTPNGSISLSGGHDTDAEMRGYWEKLAAGGTVVEPLAVAPWGDAFGMVTDKFGVFWLVNIAGEQG